MSQQTRTHEGEPSATTVSVGGATNGAQRTGASLMDAIQFSSRDVCPYDDVSDMERESLNEDVEYSRTWGSEVEQEMRGSDGSEWLRCDSEIAFNVGRLRLYAMTKFVRCSLAASQLTWIMSLSNAEVSWLVYRLR